MDTKKIAKEILAFGSSNSKNRQEAINMALQCLAILSNMPEHHKISDTELNKIVGGLNQNFKSCVYSGIWTQN